MSSNSESYLDWADKGRSSFLIYLIGFILIVLFWLLLGEFFSAPIRSLVQSGFDESVAGTLLIDFSSFLPALIVVPLATCQPCRRHRATDHPCEGPRHPVRHVRTVRVASLPPSRRAAAEPGRTWLHLLARPDAGASGYAGGA